MFLKEFEGESLFSKYEIPVPRSVLLSKNDKDGDKLEEKLKFFLDNMSGVREFVVKPQLLRGKRGKSGAISFVTREEALEVVDVSLGAEFGSEKVSEVLVAERLDVGEELYLSIAIDRFYGCPVLVFSREGGVDIEELAEKSPDKIVKILFSEINQWNEKELDEKLSVLVDDAEVRIGIKEIVVKLFELFIKEDLILAEINPLILCKDGNLLAADAKVIVDDNATSRHAEYVGGLKRELSTLEFVAREAGLSYVELDGDLAIIGNGAGLVMATLDAVNDYGGRPANFCDIGGGASSDMMKKALDIVLKKKNVGALFINIFGGITHCDEIAMGIVNYLQENVTMVPMVVRIIGTKDKEAREILDKNGIEAYDSFNEAAKKAASLV